MDRKNRDDESESSTESTDRIAAGVMLQSLDEHEVDVLFANMGTDHTPILEAAGRSRRMDHDIPDIAITPHEYVAMSAAHGYAAVTGKPQAVLVHVDVGTQNLGSAMHNAYRANVPVFIMAGMAPIKESGPGSRSIATHYKQDVFDQSGIVADYCKWTEEYRIPADPDALITRGLIRARQPPQGPVYLTATREAWESSVQPSDKERSVDFFHPSGADENRTKELFELVADADAPLVITSQLGKAPRAQRGIETLVDFAEAAGAGVVEHIPSTLSFPRDHDHHVGYDPTPRFDQADLVLLVGVDIPWIPPNGEPRENTPIIQIDLDTTKSRFPYWDFPIDYAIEADPIQTLENVTKMLSQSDTEPGGEVWRRERREWKRGLAETVEEHKESGRLTPELVSEALNDFTDDDSIVLADPVTNTGALLNYLELSKPGSYHAKYGAGLGWAPPAAVGAKMAAPDKRVLSVVGDGAYMFGHPSSTAWFSASQNAPSLTIVYNNSGWRAVQAAVERQHPEGKSAADGVPESWFDPPLDLAQPATLVDAYTETVTDAEKLSDALSDGIDAVDAGKPAVIDVKVEPIH